MTSSLLLLPPFRRLGLGLAIHFLGSALILTRFLHANRCPPRIKSGAGFRSKTLWDQKERGPSLRWSPSTVGALPGMCANRSCGRDLLRDRAPGELTCCKRAPCAR